MPALASDQTPPSSGPLCSIASAISLAMFEATESSSNARRSRNPAIPHIQCPGDVQQDAPIDAGSSYFAKHHRTHVGELGPIAFVNIVRVPAAEEQIVFGSFRPEPA